MTLHAFDQRAIPEETARVAKQQFSFWKKRFAITGQMSKFVLGFKKIFNSRDDVCLINWHLIA